MSLAGSEMTETNPRGKRSVTNGIWYVKTGLVCFGNSLEEFL